MTESMEDSQQLSPAQAWNAAIASLRHATEMIQLQNPPEKLGYRWMSSLSGESRQCVADIGIFSRGRGSWPPWQSTSIHNHCNGVRKNFESEYMSLSVSPGRILNLMGGARADPNAEIAVIDMGLLGKMQQPIALTTTLAKIHELKTADDDNGGTKHVTDTHYLVYEFVPACCVLGFVRPDTFRRVCGMEFNRSSDPHFSKRLQWETLRPHLSRSSTLARSIQHSNQAPASPQDIPDTPRTPSPLQPLRRAQNPMTPQSWPNYQTQAYSRKRPHQRDLSPTPLGRKSFAQPEVIDMTQDGTTGLSSPFREAKLSPESGRANVDKTWSNTPPGSEYWSPSSSLAPPNIPSPDPSPTSERHQYHHIAGFAPRIPRPYGPQIHLSHSIHDKDNKDNKDNKDKDNNNKNSNNDDVFQ